jgi:uncharacterized protein involved in exopolysaccharide biosynthesis
MVIQLTPRGLLNVVFRHRFMIGFVFLFCIGGAAAYDIFAPAYYEVRSSVLVKFGKNAMAYGGQDAPAGANNTPLDRKEIVNSQIKILQSRQLISSTLTEIGVGVIYPDLIEDPPARGTPLDAAVERFGSDLSVLSPRDTNVVEISLFDEQRDVGLRVVDLLVNRFIEENLRLFSDPQSSFLQEQLEFFHRKVGDAEDAVTLFKANNRISSIDEERTLLLKQRTDVDTTLKAADAHVAELKSKKDGLSAALSNTTPDVELYNESEQQRSVDDTKQKLHELEVRERNLLVFYTENAPPVIATRAELGAVRRALADEQKARAPRVRIGKNMVYQQLDIDRLRNDADLQSAAASAAETRTQIDQIAARLFDLDALQAQMQNLGLQLEAAVQNYKTYIQRNEEARIAENLNRQKIASISIIEPAVSNVKPARPRILLNLAAAVLLGAFLGLMAAFLRETFDDTYSTPEQVEKSLGVPVLLSVFREKRAA